MRRPREPKTIHEIFAENLAKSGYSNVDLLTNILNKLSNDEIEKLSEATYYACEKIGSKAFDCFCLFGEEDNYHIVTKKSE